MKHTPTRSRNHPLGLTLLSENYKQLLSEFQDFQGASRGGSSSSSEADDDTDSRTAGPPVSCSVVSSSPARPPVSLPADQPLQQRTPSKAHKRPGSSNKAVARTPPKKQQAQLKSGHSRPALSPRQPSAVGPADAAPACHTAPVAKGAPQQQQQQQHTPPEAQQRRLLKRQASKQPPPPQADVLSVDASSSTINSNAQSSEARPAPAAAGSKQGRQPHDVVPEPTQPVTQTGSVPGKHVAEQQGATAQPAATPTAAAVQPAAEQPAPTQKRPRRRVGDSGQQPNSGSSSSSVPPASASAGSSAAAAAAAAEPPAARPAAAPARSPVELPRLPLQRLQAGGPLLLPPLHPSTARAASHSAGSTKASKSEPASARMSRRTSECNNSADGGCADSSGHRSDNSAAAGNTARQHSLPEGAAVPSSRHHSIACLVEVSRKQQQLQQQRAKASSDGGMLPACSTTAASSSGSSTNSSVVQRLQPQQPLQPLQPLKQLQEIRRRSQLRAGAEDSSQDCQTLILEGPPVASDSSKQGSGSRSLADAPAPVHRRTRSSNTQLPPLDEHAVLSDPGFLPSVVQPAPAAQAGPQVLTLPAATRPGGDGFGGLQHVGSDGWGVGGSGHHSRRSSRADSEGSSGADSSAGGLVCEPSTFGVCADPAGAVHLVTPAIPDKLARLKQRLPSRLTADNAAVAVAAAQGSPAISAALQGSSQPSASAEPLLTAATARPAPAGKPERVRSRRQWQLPAVTPQPQPGEQQLQQVAAPQQEQQGQHERHGPGVTHAKSCRQGREVGGSLAEPTGQQVAASNPASWGAHCQQHVQPQSWDGSVPSAHQYAEASTAAAAAMAAAQQQQQQQQQQGMSNSFLAELKRQLEQYWNHLHGPNPQQVTPPPQLPPHLQAAMVQQAQYQQQIAQQQQQQQHQQQQQQQYFMPHPAAQQAAAFPGGYLGPVPAHGALSRFTDPWAEKQQQRLLQHRQSAHAGCAEWAAVAQQQAGSWQPPPQQQQEQASPPPPPPPPPPPVVSASALAQQRRAMQQQVFEGLSLEAVLASAKKSKPPSRRQLDVGGGSSGPGGELAV